MPNRPLTAAQAHAIMAILQAEVGASLDEDNVNDFVFEFTGNKPTSNWRFGGSLGFGGKFHFPGLNVNCYPEDETPQRRSAIDKANARLSELKRSWEHEAAGE